MHVAHYDSMADVLAGIRRLEKGLGIPSGMDASPFEVLSRFAADFHGRGPAELDDGELAAWIAELVSREMRTNGPH